jgi:ribose transport system substrate-binding protein
MKKSIKTIYATLLLVIVMAFTGCTKAEDVNTAAGNNDDSGAKTAPTQAAEVTPNGDTTAKKDINIVFLEGTDSNSWRTQCENSMQKLADDYLSQGIIAKYKLMVANNDATTQIQQMEQAIQDKVDLILINPVTTTGLSATIDKAIAQGIVVMSLDQHISHPDVISVTNDQYKWAKIQVDWLVQQLGGKGKIYRMDAIQGAPASDIREKAFNDVLSQNPDITTIAQDYGFWDEGKGKQIMTQWLATDSNYDAVLCQDGLAVGILEAIEDAGLPYPKAITSDEYIQYLKKWKTINDSNPDSPLNAIIVENPPSIGVLAMKIGVRLINGEALKDGALVSDPIDPDNKNALFYDPTVVITNENLDQYYEMYKDADDSAYIDTDMTDTLVDTYFN